MSVPFPSSEGDQMGHPVAYFEVISIHHDRAQRFYSELFDWQITTNPALGGYGSVDTGGGEGALGGGIGPALTQADAGVRFYVRVTDLYAALTRAVQLGGTQLTEPAVLPGGHGHFAMFADPDGLVVGLWA